MHGSKQGEAFHCTLMCGPNQKHVILCSLMGCAQAKSLNALPLPVQGDVLVEGHTLLCLAILERLARPESDQASGAHGAR